jgi:hypothetical protein
MYPIHLNEFKVIDFLSIKPQLLYSERKDTKFIFHKSELQSIIDSLVNEYQLVVHYGKYSQNYSTIYYDSPELKYYLAHHNGHGNRMKMRTRTYENGSSFFEVKQKTNKGVTLKERYTSAESKLDGLYPQLEVIYERITLYDKCLQEKVTVDFNIQFLDGERKLGYQQLVIVESKKIKKIYSPFLELMKKKRIEDVSMSKYCLGVVSLFDQVKKNNFKKLIHKIQKLNHNYNGISTAC